MDPDIVEGALSQIARLHLGRANGPSPGVVDELERPAHRLSRNERGAGREQGVDGKDGLIAGGTSETVRRARSVVLVAVMRLWQVMGFGRPSSHIFCLAWVRGRQ